MKKSIIAAGAASVALAAMPIVGAFAITSVTDELTITVGDACTMTDNATGGRALSESVDAGTVETINGSSFSITCNGDSWSVTAVGAGSGSPVSALYDASTTNTIPTATTDLDGSTSGWAYRLSMATTAGVTNASSDWTLVPTSATTAISSSTTPVTGLTITPSYQVSVAPGTSGTYEGGVTYTVGVVAAP